MKIQNCINTSRKNCTHMALNIYSNCETCLGMSLWYHRKADISVPDNSLVKIDNINTKQIVSLVSKKGCFLCNTKERVNFFQLRPTIKMYIFVCTNKQCHLLYDLTENLPTNSKVQKPFSWYCCLVVHISPLPVNQIT